MENCPPAVPGSAAGLQLRLRFVPAALLVMPSTALAQSAFLELEIGQVMEPVDLPSLCY